MTTIAEMVARWESAERPMFKGSLIDDNGCCCAQGDVLRVCGMSDEELRRIKQSEADRRVPDELGISVTHSVLLRQTNDHADGCPQDVLAHPERLLGDQAPKVLAFWRRLDAMSQEDWDAAGDAAGYAAGYAAAWATNEIQGAERLEKFYFLPLFGIPDHAALEALT